MFVNYIRSIVKNTYEDYPSIKGQTLVEALIALSILVVVVSAVAYAVVASTANSTYLKRQNLANKLSQDGMEFARNAQMNNLYLDVTKGATHYVIPPGTPYISFNNFISSSTGLNDEYCFPSDNTLVFDSNNKNNCLALPNGTITSGSEIFIRTLTIYNIQCQQIKVDGTGIPPTGYQVTITTNWSGSKCSATDSYCNSSQVSSCFVINSPMP